MICWLKINSPEEAVFYSEIFNNISGHYIPPGYFLISETYLFYNSKSEPIGGYLLKPYGHRRSIEQIPGWAIINAPREIRDIIWSHRFTEANGLFVEHKEKALIMVLHGIWKICFSPWKHFVYSYDLNNKRLEKLYSHAKPIRIYSGKVENLDGMTGDNYENIEVITKFNFIKLLINWGYRSLVKSIRKKLVKS